MGASDDVPALPMFTVHGDSITIQPELSQALGEIVIEWSRLEQAITDDLDQMRLSPVVAALTDVWPRGFEKRVTIWKRAILALYPSVAQYCEFATEITPRMKYVSKLRNRLIHGMWPADGIDADGKFYVYNLRDGGLLDFVAVDQKFLASLRSEVLQLSGRLAGFNLARTLHAQARPPRAPRGS